METVILIIIGLAVSGIIIRRLVKSTRHPSSECGCCRDKSKCHTCNIETLIKTGNGKQPH
ncbi:MAG: hypothetical protein JXA46_09335 [Dehalococcoidales bacterium]|nr:hypothetical protein [Dehalococcoidales bacterium]